jgi:hypothetical protein
MMNIRNGSLGDIAGAVEVRLGDPRAVFGPS